MQRDDQRPPASGRPSLLSDAPQPDTSRSGILHGLEGGGRPAAAAPASQGKRKNLVLAAAGAVVVLLVVVAAMAWPDGAAEPAPGLAMAPTPVPSAAAPAAPGPKVTCFTCHRGALKPLTAPPPGEGRGGGGFLKF